MGQSKQAIHRGGESSSRNFLSPTTGTFIGPNGAGKDMYSKTSRAASTNYTRVLPYAVAIFGFAFLASAITASIMTPVKNSDAAQVVQASLDDSGYYANVTASDTVDLSLISTADGAVSLAHDTIITTTNSPTGYKLYISSDSSTANSNRLNLDGSISASYFLSPTGGTISTPATLDNNSWGYTTTAVTGNTNTITETSNFIGLPLLNSENLLRNHNSATPTGDSLEIYYGIKANTSLPSGYYTGRVVYTVVAEGSPASEGKVNISSNEATSLNPSLTIMISTGLYTSAANVGTVTAKIGNQNCGNITPTVSNTGELKISCTVPAQTAWGDYDVAVTIPKYEKSYTLEKGFHYYVPWEDMTEMQEMTSYACSKVATPNAWTSDSPTYSYGNGVTEAQVKASPSSYWIQAVVDGARMTNINTDVPERTLTDTRNGETYRVRKLADGNCWMTENLRLTWEAGDTVITQNGTWQPHYSTETVANMTHWGNDATVPDCSSKGQNYTSSYYDRSLDASIYTNSNTSAAGKIRDLDGDEQKIGVWYNWKAATAGTGTWEMTDDQTATDSICPKSWQLPANSGSKSWYHLLYEVYGGSDLNDGNRLVINVSNPTYKDFHTYAMTDAVRRSPLDLPFTGSVGYTSGTIDGVGNLGDWWASSAASVTGGRHFVFYSGRFYPQANDPKGHGFAVRCVAQ